MLLQVSAPELTDLETSDRVDCSDTHVWNVRNSHAALIETLKDQYDDGASLEAIVTEALSPADIGALEQAGYADVLPIETATLDTTTADGDTPPMDTRDGDNDTEAEADDDSAPTARGVPSEGDVMTASPSQLLASTDTDAATSQRRLTEAAPEELETPTATSGPTESEAAGEDDAADAIAEKPSSDVSVSASEEQSVSESLVELHSAISVGRGMLAAAASGVDVQSQAVAFAAQLDAKCAEIRRRHADSE